MQHLQGEKKRGTAAVPDVWQRPAANALFSCTPAERNGAQKRSLV